ncbi:MAG TPA: hypothetical protein GXX18_02620 [Bacillales bacterium]|nr:hypothetical protein [Bacillales bacterium]
MSIDFSRRHLCQNPPALAGGRLNPKQQNKWQLIQHIQQDHQAGMSFRGLSRKYKIDRRTISKYIKMVNFPIQKRKSRPSMLNPYLETIHQMMKNHSTSRQIYEHIKKQGFKGGFDSVRVRVTCIRKEITKTVQEPPTTKSYHRKATMHLYWKLHQQLSDKERKDLNYALATFPNTQELYGFVQYFRENMNHYDSLSIQKLIASSNNHNTPEIKSFINYLYKELESIILSIQALRYLVLKKQLNKD